MTVQVNVYEAKTRLSALLSKVAAGEEVIIARHGRPVARLVAFPIGRPGERRAAGRVGCGSPTSTSWTNRACGTGTRDQWNRGEDAKPSRGLLALEEQHRFAVDLHRHASIADVVAVSN
jgi:prevent-host-death family protein